MVIETKLKGAYVVEPEPAGDERGLFARTFCRDEFAALGLDTRVAQCSTSYNRRRGTLRGLHYQAEPYPEAKLVRCTAGSVYDVVVDLRPESHAFRRWFAVELTASSRRALYVPAGVAHGFQTLVAGAELLYMIDRPYAPGAARGVRWDDPALGIEWPDAPDGRTMSERDRGYPDFDPGTGSTR